MSRTPTTHLPFGEIVQNLRRHRRLWLGATLACTAIALVAALLKRDEWNAVQAVLVRNEAQVSELAPVGRFGTIDQMKTAQETIQEIARNDSVLKGALEQMGPPEGTDAAQWPTEQQLRKFREKITITAPNGAEFGETEVMHFSVQGSTRVRAAGLADALCDHLELQLQQLRTARASGVIAELEHSVTVATDDLAAITSEVEQIEKEVGSDLGELRILNESAAGDSNLRATLTEVDNEIRQAQAQLNSYLQQYELLLAARDDENRLIAAPGSLLQSQPALLRMKEGLVDAQLRTAQFQSRMSNDHPQVRAAIEEQDRVRQQLFEEVELAIQGTEADIEVSQQQLASLQAEQSQVQVRLERLASLRARYSNLVAEQRRCIAELDGANNSLAEARADQMASRDTSVVVRLDLPQVGEHPMGPSRSMIVFAGLMGGIGLGLGLVFLMVPASQAGRRWGRRIGEAMGRGRRSSDRPGSPGRRQEDGARVAEARQRKTQQSNSRRAEDYPASQRRAEDHPMPGRRAEDRSPSSDIS